MKRLFICVFALGTLTTACVEETSSPVDPGASYDMVSQELSCLSPEYCEVPAHCPGGLDPVPGPCCPICPARYNDDCGGPWNINGVCADGLVCELEPTVDGEVSFNSSGTCVREDGGRGNRGINGHASETDSGELTCQSDADCRLFGTYCADTPCACYALHVSETDPVCTSRDQVLCFAEPCLNQAAICDAGTCRLSSESASF